MAKTKGTGTRSRGDPTTKIPTQRLRGVIGWLELAIAGNSVAAPTTEESARERLHALTLGISRAIGMLTAYLPDEEPTTQRELFDAAQTTPTPATKALATKATTRPTVVAATSGTDDWGTTRP